LKLLREEWKTVGAQPQIPGYEFRRGAYTILDYKLAVDYTIDATKDEDGQFRVAGILSLSWLDSYRWELRRKSEPELWERLTREAQR
jgi:hypothetical protein